MGGFRGAAVALAVLVPMPLAASGEGTAVAGEAGDAACADELGLTVCVSVIARGTLDCGLEEPGVGRCAGIAEWIYVAGSPLGLPGAADGAFALRFETCVVDVCAVQDQGGAFEHCAWAPASLGCGDMALGQADGGPVELAPGECLEVSMTVATSGAAESPSAPPLALLTPSAAASVEILDAVCA